MYISFLHHAASYLTQSYISSGRRAFTFAFSKNSYLDYLSLIQTLPFFITMHEISWKDANEVASVAVMIVVHVS